jgi:hypothetical protein
MRPRDRVSVRPPLFLEAGPSLIGNQTTSFCSPGSAQGSGIAKLLKGTEQHPALASCANAVKEV